MSIAVALGLLLPALAQAVEPTGRLKVFQAEVLPLLKTHCMRCHGAEQQEGDLSLSQLNPDLVQGSDAETWHDVLNKLNLGQMPPAKEPQPTPAERKLLTDWLTSELQHAIDARRSTGGRVVFRRLTNYEYQNTMRDLIGLDLNYAAELPPESTSPEGFQNNGASLGVSAMQIEYYLQAARNALRKAIVSGPRPESHSFAQEIRPLVLEDFDTTGMKPQQIENKRQNLLKNFRKKQKGAAARLEPKDTSSYYQTVVQQFPREGDILIRITAEAAATPEVGFPRLQVALGVRADTQSPERILGEADVTAPAGQPQVLEFRGRIEDFPLPGHNPKFPGLRINLRNVYQGPVVVTKDTEEKADRESAPAIVLKSIEFLGPVSTSWPPESHTQILFPRDESLSESEYARQVLERFLRRAYRRPATEADLEPLLAFFAEVRPTSPTLEEAFRETLSLALISPDFLYLVEPRTDAGRQPLTDHELASRLSYFLWSTMPDAPLMAAADAGQLRQPEQLAAQVTRMLDDPRSGQFVKHFSNQWLNLSGLTRVAVNPQFYGKFDDRLKDDMQRETQQFFAEILNNQLSALLLIDSDFVMLNRPLAEHYGLPGPRGMDFERVPLEADSIRGGLLTQGSFLLTNSNGEDSHPIRRAVWLLDRLLDNPPAPPPPDVPELDSKSPSVAGLPLKQQLEMHRAKESCNGCHRGIDPWGVAFENFDAVGQWRTIVTGRGRKPAPVDAAAVLPDGTEVAGVADLQRYLLEKQQQPFARSLAKRVLVYALGRSLELPDEAIVDELTAQFASDDYRLDQLIARIVASEPFQTK
ncbi:DUF1592 domain-containing protein [Lignipirellula cremea]|uniref:DUF1592 domain-containing protein n=1 Tax=Lignipirellula cremea TaxID=2528010 RepID=UPI0018D1FC9D|nr:DUF1592 domain-containing protein [Lignipirellula cremea]